MALASFACTIGNGVSAAGTDGDGGGATSSSVATAGAGGTASTSTTETRATTASAPSCGCPDFAPRQGDPCPPDPACSSATCWYDTAYASVTLQDVFAGPGCGAQGYVCSPGGTWEYTVSALCNNDEEGCAKLSGDRLTCIETPGCRWIDNFSSIFFSFDGACFPALDCQMPRDCSPGSTCVMLEPAGVGVTASGDTMIVMAHVCAFCAPSVSPCMGDLDCCSGVCSGYTAASPGHCA